MLRQLSLLLPFVVGALAAINCKPTVEGTSYDFTKMIKAGTDADYTGANTDPTDSYFYTMNVCAVSTSSYAGGDCGSNGGWFCQFDQGKTTLVATVASVSAAPLPSWNKLDDGVMLVASNGDKCFYQGQEIDRKLQVTFKCASKTGSTFEIYEDADDSKCLFHASIESEEACGGGGLSGGWIFIIIVLVSLVVYCAAGFAFMVFKKGEKAPPNMDFWRAFIQNIKDGGKYTVMMIKTKGKGGGETYDEL